MNEPGLSWSVLAQGIAISLCLWIFIVAALTALAS